MSGLTKRKWVGLFILSAMTVALSARSLWADPVPEDLQLLADPEASATYAANWAQPLKPVFQQAADDYKVPLSLLLTLGQMGSAFENRDGAPTIERGYGVMALRDNSSGGDSLALAATLTGVSTDQLKFDPVSNIRGAAAVLDQYARQADIDRKAGLEAWQPVLVRYAALDAECSQLFAAQVYQKIERGFILTNGLGENFTLAGKPVSPSATALLVHQPAQTADYGGASDYLAATCNYSTATHGSDTVVIHTIEGSASGCLSWFRNCASSVSSNYVTSEAGGIWRCVPEDYTAWTQGCYNSRSVSNEHEGYAASGSHPTALYNASALCTRDVCNRRGIPKEKRTSGPGIIGHVDVTNCCCGSHTDPGAGWNWTYYIQQVVGITAPSITGNPSSASVCPGGAADFSASASGTSPSYRWQKNTVDMGDGGHYSGTGTPTLHVASIDANDNASYRCKVSNSAGTVYSSAASLTVKASTAVTGSPSPLTRCVGETAQFTAAGTGSGTVSYQWQKNGTNLSNDPIYSGTSTATLTLTNLDAGTAADYRAVITAECGSATTTAAHLTVRAVTQVTQHPVELAKCPGSSAVFNAGGTGDGSVTFKWQKDGSNIDDGGHFSGTTLPTLAVTDVDASVLGDYRCAITATCGTTMTLSARLSLLASTAITRQPEPVIALFGMSAQMSIAAIGADLHFQWLKDDAPLTDTADLLGTSTPALLFRSIAAGDVGIYKCQVSGPCGPELSQAATLSLGAGELSDLGPTYMIGPIDINGGGGFATTTDYATMSSTGQAGGVGPIAQLPYLLNNGFWPAVFGSVGVAALMPDFDGDLDVDLSDFSAFQICLSGLSPQTDPACALAHLNHNAYVNQFDLTKFLGCLSGADIPADPHCAD